MPIRLIPGNRASGNLHSRKLGFRLTQFSETQTAETEPGLLDHVSLTADRQAILSRATTSSMAVLCRAGVPSPPGDQVQPHGAGVRPWRRITSASAVGSGGPLVAALITAAISRK